MTNGQHNRLPPQDSRASVGDQYVLHTVCKRCRLHLKLTVDYNEAGPSVCPNAERPLHHFVNQPCSKPLEYLFRCSSNDCAANVCIAYSQAVISPHDLDILTDKVLLKRRYDAAIADDPTRIGLKLVAPWEVLWRLRRYLRDSLGPDGGGKKIPVKNKRFMEAFGDECDELLNRLGFTLQLDASIWSLPAPPHHQSVRELNPERVLLENWDVELQAVIEKHCAQSGDINPDPEHVWQSAWNDAERVLSAQGYERSSAFASRSSGTSSGAAWGAAQGGTQDHPYYASLGALRDFSDKLIIFAHDRQSICDPINAPYYFDCLRDLAKGRDSEVLTTEAVTLESQGVIGRKDILEAFKYFDVSPTSSNNDEIILGRYRSRLDDSSPSAQPHIKAMLKRVGHARGSQKLIDAASDGKTLYCQCCLELNQYSHGNVCASSCMAWRGRHLSRRFYSDLAYDESEYNLVRFCVSRSICAACHGSDHFM